MKPQDDAQNVIPACEPVWVARNHLYSYCANAKSAGVPHSGKQATDTPRRQQCPHRACLFSAAQR